jgi:hypothetical protein
MRSAMSSRLEPFNKFLQESTSQHWFCFTIVKHFIAATNHRCARTASPVER